MAASGIVGLAGDLLQASGDDSHADNLLFNLTTSVGFWGVGKGLTSSISGTSEKIVESAVSTWNDIADWMYDERDN